MFGSLLSLNNILIHFVFKCILRNRSINCIFNIYLNLVISTYRSIHSLINIFFKCLFTNFSINSILLILRISTESSNWVHLSILQHPGRGLTWLGPDLMQHWLGTVQPAWNFGCISWSPVWWCFRCWKCCSAFGKGFKAILPPVHCFKCPLTTTAVWILFSRRRVNILPWTIENRG